MSAIPSYIKNLTDERQRVWHAQKAVIEAACRTDEHGAMSARALTPAEAELIRSTDAELDSLDEQIRDWQTKLAVGAQVADARSLSDAAAFLPAQHIDRASGSAFRSWLNGSQPFMELNFRDNVRTVTAAGEIEFRDLLVGTAGAGGYTVPTDFHNTLYKHLVHLSSIWQLGVQIISTDDGRALTYPKSNTYGTAAIVGEGTALAESDPSFATLSLGAWKYARLLQLSNELLTDNDVNLEGFVAEETAMALDAAYSPHFMTGTGTNQPQGIFSGTYGTGVTGQTGSTGVPSYGNLVDTVHSVARPYRDGAQWLWKDATVASIRKIVDTTGRPIWSPSITADQPDTLLGYPVVVDPNAPTAGTGIVSGAFGNFERGYVVRQTPMRLEMSNDYAFANDLRTYRAVWRLDGKINDTGAVKVYKGGAS